MQFFHLSWTVVHPITEDSPLFGETAESLREADLEVLILMKGFDETFSQVVHARRSYKGKEIEFGRRFAQIINTGTRLTTIDLDRISETESAAL